MADTFYSTVADVLEDTGIEPSDLDFEDGDGLTAQQKLEAKVTKWLIESKAAVDMNASVYSGRTRDYAQEVEDGYITEIPVCIHDIAKRITINKVKQAVINRETPIVSRDDYNIQVTNDSIITTAILNDLEACVVGRSKKKAQSLTIFRVKTVEE